MYELFPCKIVYMFVRSCNGFSVPGLVVRKADQMSAKTRNLFYIVFIVLSLTVIFALSVSYITIARTTQHTPPASAHTSIAPQTDADLSLSHVASDRPPAAAMR